MPTLYGVNLEQCRIVDGVLFKRGLLEAPRDKTNRLSIVQSLLDKTNRLGIVQSLLASNFFGNFHYLLRHFSVDDEVLI